MSSCEYSYLAIGGPMSAAASGSSISEAVTKCIARFPLPSRFERTEVHRVVVWKVPKVLRARDYGHPDLPPGARPARVVFEARGSNTPDGPRWREVLHVKH